MAPHLDWKLIFYGGMNAPYQATATNALLGGQKDGQYGLYYMRRAGRVQFVKMPSRVTRLDRLAGSDEVVATLGDIHQTRLLQAAGEVKCLGTWNLEAQFYLRNGDELLGWNAHRPIVVKINGLKPGDPQVTSRFKEHIRYRTDAFSKFERGTNSNYFSGPACVSADGRIAFEKFYHEVEGSGSRDEWRIRSQSGLFSPRGLEWQWKAFGNPFWWGEFVNSSTFGCLLDEELLMGRPGKLKKVQPGLYLIDLNRWTVRRSPQSETILKQGYSLGSLVAYVSTKR